MATTRTTTMIGRGKDLSNKKKLANLYLSLDEWERVRDEEVISKLRIWWAEGYNADTLYCP